MLVFQLEKNEAIPEASYLRPKFKGVGHQFFERSIGIEEVRDESEWEWLGQEPSNSKPDQTLEQFEALKLEEWMKMWELAAILDPYLEQISNSKSKEFKCFALGPIPKLADELKRIIDCRFPGIVWDCDTTPAGCWCDGDTENADNIRSWSKPQYNLVLSGSSSPLANVCSILGCLVKGGSAITTTHSNLEPCELAILTTKFDRVLIVRPESTSIFTNGHDELFIVCIGFNGDASDQHLLLNILEYQHTRRRVYPITQSAISYDFAKSLASITKTIADWRQQQIDNLSRTKQATAHLSEARLKIITQSQTEIFTTQWKKNFKVV
jgi:hypothetical protein